MVNNVKNINRQNLADNKVKLKRRVKYCVVRNTVENKFAINGEEGFINTNKFSIDVNKEQKREGNCKVCDFENVNEKTENKKQVTTKSKKCIRNSVSPKHQRIAKSVTETAIKSEPEHEIKPGPTQAARACMQYCRAAQQALTLLNNEVSSALRNSFSSLNDIQMRVRDTMEEMNKSDLLYKYLRNRRHQTPASYSTPQLTKCEGLVDNDNIKDSSLVHALNVGLVQTQSENQMRLSVLPSIQEISTESNSISTIKDIAKQEEDENKKELPIIPKLIKVIEDPKQSCTVLKQQKKVSTAPMQLNLDEVAQENTTNEIKKKSNNMEDVSEADELHRIQAQPNLHGKFIKEFKANDSLLEFQRKIKHVKNNRKNKAKDAVLEKNQATHIMAEEIFVPEKINKIAATNLNSSQQKPNKTTQFFYREKRKNKKKYIINANNTNVTKKYPDSLLFSSNRDKNGINPTGTEIIDDQLTDSRLNSYYLENISKNNTQPVSNKTGLDCFDILDEITLKDVQPIVSEYPRKDHIGSKMFETKVEDTYLYKLVSGSVEDKFLKLVQFEQPQLCECQNCEKSGYMKPHQRLKKHPDSYEKPEKPNVKRIKKISKEEIEAKLKPYIFDPHMRYPTTITVMPIMITTYANPHYIDEEIQTLKSTKTSMAKLAKKKLWENKYQKPISYNFVSYLNKQNSESSQQSLGNRFNEYTLQKKIGIQKPMKTLKQLKKSSASHTMLQKHAAESRKLLKDIQKLSQRTKLESNIQTVIEMIENKIVEILSNPEKTHGEAFARVEVKILEILNSIQCNENLLESIVESGDGMSETPLITEVHDIEELTMNTTKQSEISKNKTEEVKGVVRSVEQINTTITNLYQPSVMNDSKVENTKSRHEKLKKKSMDKLPEMIGEPCTILPNIQVLNTNATFTANINRPNKLRKLSSMGSKSDFIMQTPKQESLVKTKSTSKLKITTAETVKIPKQELVQLIKTKSTSKLNVTTAEVQTPKHELVSLMKTKSISKVKLTTADVIKIPKQELVPLIKTISTSKLKVTTAQVVQTPKHELIPLIETKSTSKLKVTTAEVVQNIIESTAKVDKFLATVKNIKINKCLDSIIPGSNDMPINLFTKQFCYVIHYKHKFEISYILYPTRAFHPITVYVPTLITMQTKSFPTEFDTSIDELKESEALFPIKLMKHVNPTTKVICCRVDKIVSGINSYRRFLDQIPQRTLGTQSENEVLDSTIEETDHNSFLATIYSLLFSTIFLGLTFNYSCN